MSAILRRIAVVLVRDTQNGGGGPTLPSTALSECQVLLESGEYSVANFWRDNTENWFDFSFGYFGPYQVALEPAPSTPEQIGRIALQAAASSTTLPDFSGFNGFIIFHSTTEGYIPQCGKLIEDEGRPCCTIPMTETHTSISQNFGYLLHGAWKPNEFRIPPGEGLNYGNPYEIMSPSVASPLSVSTFQLPDSAKLSSFPNFHLKAGPMLSRAHLHFTLGMPLETRNKVKHIYEGASITMSATLNPAGGDKTDQVELICFHPLKEKVHGVLYVEFRQQRNYNFRSRWDKGLDGIKSKNDPDIPGLVIHTTQNLLGMPVPKLRYSGRIPLPIQDGDISVMCGGSLLTISVSPLGSFDLNSGPFSVRFARGYERVLHIHEETKHDRSLFQTQKQRVGWVAGKEVVLTWTKHIVTTVSRFSLGFSFFYLFFFHVVLFWRSVCCYVNAL